MGFFSSGEKPKSKELKKKQSRWNLTDPPNVYTKASQSQPLPYRPPPPPQPQQWPYANVQASYTQPALSHPSQWSPPPAQRQPMPQKQKHTHTSRLGRWTGSMLNLADMAPISDAYEELCARFDDVMTQIDNESVSGTENNLFSYKEQPDTHEYSNDRALTLSNAIPKRKAKTKTKQPKPASQASQVASGTYFAKVELYANSKLPANLPSLVLYMPTWPLLSLAAQYSQRVYDKPAGQERNSSVYTSGNWRSGTKATYLKSVPMDHAHTIVFAIRGTSSFMDWAVNLNSAPTSPAGFLDDAGNLCHAGFLSVARKMVGAVSARLRQLLEEDPGRAAYSLLITGHSAGGAVAALLYMHMVSTSREAASELNDMAGCFKRIHCVTFGAPPVSLLPLQKPNVARLRKSLFLGFVNEGDPVVRADKAYIKCLLELLASPPPEQEPLLPGAAQVPSRQRIGDGYRVSSSAPPPKPPRRHKPPTWPVPTCTLSNAGRIVVLRSGDPMAVPREKKTVKQRLDEGVVAATCKEEMLRGVIWGDPVCHLMSFYAARIEVLAVAAVTAK